MGGGGSRGGDSSYKTICASLYALGKCGLTFCQSIMRMKKEMITRTTKARMAEITTTLKGEAGSRDKG